MQFRKAYFRSLVHPSRKLWPKPNSGNSVPCVLPYKIVGLQNLIKERYLSNTTFLTIVYLSKCNKNLPCFFGNSKKKIIWTGSDIILISCLPWVLQHICQAIMDQLLWFGFPLFFGGVIFFQILRFLLTSYEEDKMSKILVKLFKIAGIFVRRPIHSFCSCDTSTRNLSRNGGCEARDRPQHNGVIPKQDGGESK